MILNTPHKKAPIAAAPGRKALLVLGVHRSGTSALAGVTEILGATAPGDQIQPDPPNPRGYFESARIARLDDRLLGLSEQTWDNWQPLPPIEAGQDLCEKARTILHEEFGYANTVVLKDPRLCRLVPFWTKSLQKWQRQPLYLLTTRNPHEVAQSLQARNGFKPSHGLLLWMTYVLEAEASTRGKARTFTSFDLLLNDPLAVAGKVFDLMERPLPQDLDAKVEKIKAFLTHELHHQQADGSQDLPPLIRSVYQVLDRWAREGENPADHPQLDRALRLYQHVSSLSQDPDAVLAALNMLDDVTPLHQRIAEVEELQEPQLREQYQALLRANAASNAALQSAYSLLPGQILARDKQLATLGRLFANLKDSTESLQVTQAVLRAANRASESRANGLDAQLAEAQARQRKVENENTELHALVAKVEDKRARLQGENTELHALVARVEKERARLQGEISDMHARVAEADAERRAVLHSTSWRLTAPIRAAKRVFLRSG